VRETKIRGEKVSFWFLRWLERYARGRFIRIGPVRRRDLGRQ
jgi:hypothetical protein